jgi:hypothetical protein
MDLTDAGHVTTDALSTVANVQGFPEILRAQPALSRSRTKVCSATNLVRERKALEGVSARELPLEPVGCCRDDSERP